MKTACDISRIEKYRRITDSELDSRLFKTASAQGRTLTGSLAGTSREHRIDFVRRHPDETVGMLCSLIPKTASRVRAQRRRHKVSDYDRGERFVGILLGDVVSKSAAAEGEPGRGRMGGELAAGAGGVCKCTECGAEIKHDRAKPCTDVKCPKCGGKMARKDESVDKTAAEAADGFWDKLVGMVKDPGQMWAYAKKHPDQVAGILGALLGGIGGAATGDGAGDRMARAGMGAVGGGAAGYGAGLLGKQIAEWLGKSRKKDDKGDNAGINDLVTTPSESLNAPLQRDSESLNSGQ